MKTITTFTFGLFFRNNSKPMQIESEKFETRSEFENRLKDLNTDEDGNKNDTAFIFAEIENGLRK